MRSTRLATPEVFRCEETRREEQVPDGAGDSPVEIGDLARDFADDFAQRRVERAILLAAVCAKPAPEDSAAVVTHGGRIDGDAHSREGSTATMAAAVSPLSPSIVRDLR